MNNKTRKKIKKTTTMKKINNTQDLEKTDYDVLKYFKVNLVYFCSSQKKNLRRKNVFKKTHADVTLVSYTPSLIL